MAQAVAACKAWRRRCDLVVIEGTDFTGPSSPLEFDFNARIARHLGAPVLAVVNGHDRDVGRIVAAVRVGEESLAGQGDTVLAMIVNRVPPTVHADRRRPGWPAPAGRTAGVGDPRGRRRCGTRRWPSSAPRWAPRSSPATPTT